MTDKQYFILSNAIARRNAMEAVRTAPEGWHVTITPPRRNADQNAKFHAMLGDFAKQLTFVDRKFDIESWKRLTVDQFEVEIDGKPSLAVPSLDFQRVVTLGSQTRNFSVKKALNYIDWLYAYGIDHGVRFSRRALDVWEEAKSMGKAA
jgi:hypothetical protein